MTPTLSYQDIKALGPCYDPVKWIPVDWVGPVAWILALEPLPPVERLWVCVRHTFLSNRQLSLFAMECALLCKPKSDYADEYFENLEKFIDGKLSRREFFLHRAKADRLSRNDNSAISAAWNAAHYAGVAASNTNEDCSFAARMAARYAIQSLMWSNPTTTTIENLWQSYEKQECELLIKIIEEGA